MESTSNIKQQTTSSEPNPKQVSLGRYDSSWYKPGNIFLRSAWYFVNVIFFINPLIPFMGFKVFLLRLFGAKVGKRLSIKPNVNIKYPWLLQIGDDVWIGEKVWIDNLAQVSIGNNVCISQGALLLTGNHNYKRETFDLIVGRITLEDGVWIGAQSVVCPGVFCKSHAILTVNSVAVETLDAYTIYQGNPAVALRKRVIKG